jgi:hypothetical protein
MKFTKPINREVDINGEAYVVTFDENGIDFRLKGKRKSTRADWAALLAVAEGEPATGNRESQNQAEGDQRPEAASGARSEDEDEGSPNYSRTATATAGEGTTES